MANMKVGMTKLQEPVLMEFFKGNALKWPPGIVNERYVIELWRRLWIVGWSCKFVPHLKSASGLTLLTLAGLNHMRLSSPLLHNKLRFREHFLPFLREDLLQLLATPKRFEN
jgi:hypothetical protein